MGNGVGEVQKERAVMIELVGGADADEIQGSFREIIVRVAPFLIVLIFVNQEAALVPLGIAAIEIIGIIIVGMHLIEVAKPFVESFFARNTRRAFVAESPFANGASAIARALQNLGHGHILRLQGNVGIAADARVAGVFAGHQRGARGRANGAAGITTGEAHALRGELVNIGCFDSLLAIAAKITVAQVIGQDEDDGGFAWSGHPVRGCVLGQDRAGKKYAAENA